MKQQLDKICTHCDLSRAAAAEIMGVAARTLYSWQGGGPTSRKTPPDYFRRKIASVARMVDAGYCPWLVREMLDPDASVSEIANHLSLCRQCRMIALEEMK